MMLKLNLKTFLTSALSSKKCAKSVFYAEVLSSYPDFGDIRQIHNNVTNMLLSKF